MRSRMLLMLVLSCAVSCTAGAGARRSRVVQADGAATAFERAREAVHRGDTIRAEQYLAAALVAGYPEELVVPELVRICVESSRLRTAVRYAEPYVRRHPEAVPLRHVLATLYLALGRDAAAVSELSDILRIAPDHASSHYLLGMHEVSRSDEAGYAHLRRYLVLEPDGRHAAEARDTLARESAQLGRGASRTDG